MITLFVHVPPLAAADLVSPHAEATEVVTAARPPSATGSSNAGRQRQLLKLADWIPATAVLVAIGALLIPAWNLGHDRGIHEDVAPRAA